MSECSGPVLWGRGEGGRVVSECSGPVLWGWGEGGRVVSECSTGGSDCSVLYIIALFVASYCIVAARSTV